MVCLRPLFCLLILAATSQAGAPLVQLTTPQRTYEGRILVGDDVRCWLAESDGQVHQLLLGTVNSFKRLPGEFRPDTPAQLREKLRSEFSGKWEFELVGNQVVCAGQKRAKPFAAILDSTSRAFAGYVSRRSFPVQKAEFPQATIVFPSFELFRTYAESEGVNATPILRGYYNPGTNRVVLYEGTPVTGQAETASHRTTLLTRLDRSSRPGRIAALTPFDPPPSSPTSLFHVKHSWLDRREEMVGTPSDAGPIASFGAVAGASLKDTLVHETIHQLAFNAGLHSRLGSEPRWVVEGFAMLLEAESTLRDDRGGGAGDRVDVERYTTFQNARPSRPKTMLRDIVTGDGVFLTNPLNAYAEAWATTFFLSETRSSQYADYLKRLSKRNRLDDYPADARQRDFEQSFGKDFVMLDVQLREFMDRLKVRTSGGR